MYADDILGTNQTGIVEITGLEEERVEGIEASVIWIVVPAGSACLESEPRLPARVPRVAGINGGGPGEDGIVAKASHLNHLLRVPVPMTPCAKFAGTERMPVLVGGPRGVTSGITVNSQIVEVEATREWAIKIMSGIQPPKSDRMI